MAIEAKRGCGYRKVGGLFVPDDDPDHMGTVYDQEEDETVLTES